MKRFALLLVFALGVTVLGQDRVYDVSDFSLGLNTVKTDRQIRPRSPEDPAVELRVCHNLDLNAFPGGVTVRLGFDSLFTIAGQDSFLWNGILTVPWLDGSKEMLLVADSDGVGYANVYRSARNTLDFGLNDSLLFVADTAAVIDSVVAWSADSVWYTLTVTVPGDTVTVSLVCDTNFSRQAIADSLATKIEASAVAAYLVASTVGDTLLIVGASSDALTSVVCRTRVKQPKFGYCSFDMDGLKQTVRIYGQNDSLRFWLKARLGSSYYYTDTLLADTSSWTRVVICDSLALRALGSDLYTNGGIPDTSVHDDSTVIVNLAADGTDSLWLFIQVYKKAAFPFSAGWYSPNWGQLATWYSGDGTWHLFESGWGVTTRSFVQPDRIASYVAATGWPRFTKYRDKVFMVNAVGRGLVYDGKHAREFPTVASGELVAVPLASAGPVNGRRRYCLRPAEDTIANTTDTTIVSAFSYLSQPVIVDSGQILLRSFPRRGFSREYSGEDSITYEIWATTGDVGSLDKLDTVWNTGLTVHVDSSNYSSVFVIDSIGDDVLRSGTGFVYMDGEFYRFETSLEAEGPPLLPFRATGNYTYYNRPGMPQMYSWDSLVGSNGIWTIGDGDTASADWLTCAGFAIMVVVIDTSQDIPADSGVSLTFFQPERPLAYGADTAALGYSNAISRQGTEKLRYILPRLADTSIVMLVYRAPIEATKYDSSFSYWYGGKWQPALYGREFKAVNYYLIGEYNPGDTVTDTLHYDSLVFREPYKRNAVAPIGTAIATLDNRLFISDGANVSYSNKADSNVSFLTFDRIPASPDDGDQATALWQASQRLARLAKNLTIFNVYQDANGNYQAAELSQHYGVVAPLSHASAPEGDYFLSRDGVRLEAEGAYKERSLLGNLMSGTIKSFLNLPVLTLKRSVGAYFGGKYMLSNPGVDTTWVLFKIPVEGGQYRYSWGTWDLTFSGTALYRVSSENVLVPTDSLYFIRSGSATVYRYGSNTTDNGQPIKFKMETGPLGSMDGELWQVADVGLWSRSTDTVDYAVEALFYNDQYSSLADVWGLAEGSETVRFRRLNAKRYHLRDVDGRSQSLYWSVRLRSASLYNSSGQIVIDGLRVRMTDAGPAGAE